VGQIDSFLLSIHADIPAGQNPEGYSKPGDSLWTRVIRDFSFRQMPPDTQGWYYPPDSLYDPIDHEDYFQYNVCLDSADWFFQDSNTIYWLNISAFIQDTLQFRWGWKSSIEQWNDDGVWAYHPDYDWAELHDEGGGVPYGPGDVDDDGDVDYDDLDYLQAFLYAGGPAPPVYDPTCAAPYPAADVNGDCSNPETSDLTYLASFLAGGPAPQFCDECPPGGPGPSLDLAFVITGEPGEPPECCDEDGIRGDADDDCTFGCITVSDASYLVTYLFGGGPAPVCCDEANADGDCTFGCITVSDASYLVTFLFGGGPAPLPCDQGHQCADYGE
jgi:hypothetical protein